MKNLDKVQNNDRIFLHGDGPWIAPALQSFDLLDLYSKVEIILWEKNGCIL